MQILNCKVNLFTKQYNILFLRYLSIHVECRATDYPVAAATDDHANCPTPRRYPDCAADYDAQRGNSTDSHPAESATVTGDNMRPLVVGYLIGSILGPIPRLKTLKMVPNAVKYIVREGEFLGLKTGATQ